MRKRIVTVVLVSAVAVGITACGGKKLCGEHANPVFCDCFIPGDSVCGCAAAGDGTVVSQILHSLEGGIR